MITPEEISAHDRREIDIFKRFLWARAKYGLVKMLKHRYWRIYTGVEK